MDMVIGRNRWVGAFGREGRNAKGPIAEPRAKRAGDKKGPGALPPLAPKTRSARLLASPRHSHYGAFNVPGGSEAIQRTKAYPAAPSARTPRQIQISRRRSF